MSKNPSTPIAAVPAVPTEPKAVAAATEPKAADVKLLVMSRAQTRAHELVIEGYEFTRDGDPVEVPADVAAGLLERRDENGAKYLVEA